MKITVTVGALVCRNCGAWVCDGYSPTGLVHVETGRARCDGERIPTEGHRGRFPLAVAK